MSKVVLNVSMSLDGFTTGPNVAEREPMGVGGERLHEWMFAGADDGVDAGVRREMDAMVGATIIGRHTFDLGLGPWGGTPWPGIPSFVVSHRPGRISLATTAGGSPSMGCRPQLVVPGVPRGTRTSRCWAQTSPGSCFGRAYSTRCASTSSPC